MKWNLIKTKVVKKKPTKAVIQYYKGWVGQKDSPTVLPALFSLV